MNTKKYVQTFGAAVGAGLLTLTVSHAALADDAGYNLPREHLERARSFGEPASDTRANTGDHYASLVTTTDYGQQSTDTEVRQEDQELSESERLWRHWDEQVSRGN